MVFLTSCNYFTYSINLFENLIGKSRCCTQRREVETGQPLAETVIHRLRSRVNKLQLWKQQRLNIRLLLCNNQDHKIGCDSGLGAGSHSQLLSK